MLANTGRLPKTLVLGYPVFVQLKNHPELKDRVKYTSDRTITPAILAMLFDIDEVLVCMAVQNPAGENEAPAMGFIQGKHALLCHKAQTPGILTPSAGYIFSWKGVSGGLGKTIGISRIPVPLQKSDRIEGEIAHDFKVVGADLGYFFANVVA